MFSHLPYSNCNIVIAHSQFNNSDNSLLPTRKKLEKLTSLYDLDLFDLNSTLLGDTNIDPDQNTMQRIQSQYFSPHSFSKRIANSSNPSFSILHLNVRSLKRNLEKLQDHLLAELNLPFSVIGITETRIKNTKLLDFNPHVDGYNFEFVPTPLSAGGVGVYISCDLDYRIIEKVSNIYFQAIWIEIITKKNKNILIGVVYRQHNSPEPFQQYVNNTLEVLSASNKTICMMGDFNIDLLKFQQCNHSKEFLHSMQSLSFIPTIDKPTRVHEHSATLIDNIFINNLEYPITSGNVVSDISDHFSQFCLLHTATHLDKPCKVLVRDYTHFSINKTGSRQCTRAIWYIC